ncbi:MAG: hypothetical protein LQ351_004887 [Letrouitia transgressa]|nr:MAG: hypothetical protein LQ351_004887 [Letrouitia transgressa]
MTFPLSRPSSPTRPHVLIIGAGITGLCLAQALKKNGISFSIFERDPDVSARGKGWGLTIHWSLDTFLSLLPQHIVDKLPNIYVDPDAIKRGENGNFLFFDLRSGEARYKVPPNKRIRVSRERLRALLLDGLDVQWSKSLSSITTDNSVITAHFRDHSTSTGSLLIGADGTRSTTRSLLLSHSPNLSRNQQLPVRLLGTSTTYPTRHALPLRALDPYFYQAGDPQTNAFHYFSFLDTPANNGRHANPDSYECQIIISYPFKSGFLGSQEAIEIPEKGVERVRLMKKIAEGWCEPFRSSVMRIPDGTEVTTINLEDWVPKKGLWDNLGGKVTMLGDAAHAMTMFRGEAANHGITDVAVLLSNIIPVLQDEGEGMKEAVDAYEAEMIARTGPAVLASRKACLDAHEYRSINDQSPLVSRRVMVTSE